MGDFVLNIIVFAPKNAKCRKDDSFIIYLSVLLLQLFQSVDLYSFDMLFDNSSIASTRLETSRLLPRNVPRDRTDPQAPLF